MQPYLDIFSSVVDARAQQFREQHALTVKAGAGLGAAILKVLKQDWTSDAPEEFLNTNGVFFSIWIDAACVDQRRARFNLHARKLRALKGDTFPAREFARAFRTEARAALLSWPAIIYPKGPVTLFEGHIPLDRITLGAEATTLVDKFVGLVPMIERVLAATTAPKQ